MRTGAASNEPLLARLRSVAVSETALYRDPPRISVECSGGARAILPTVCEDVFLIAAEALRNVLRHARARRVLISMDFHPETFRLTIEDDGTGIGAEVRERGREGHFGIRGMRERAARHGGVLTIECPDSRGTKVTLSLSAVRAYGG